ncbi:MAG: sensor histidine kinase, partial [Planctomycetota bacterium]
MKIGQKLILGYIFVALLVAVVGYVSLLQLLHITEPLERDIPEAIEKVNKASNLDLLAGDIHSYDEVLTQSARNYAFTQDKKWEQRYREFEPKLDTQIKEAIGKSDEQDKDFFLDVNKANLALVKMEYESMELVNKGRSQDAVRILESDEYWEQKKIYGQGLDNYRLRKDEQREQALSVSTQTILMAADRADDVVRRAIHLISILSLIALILAIILGFIISGIILRPIKKLEAATTQIGNGNLDTRIEVNSKDEIGQLASSFNKMAEDLSNTTTSLDNLRLEVVERSKAEKAISDSEEKYRRLVENLKQEYFFYSHGLDGIFQYISPSITYVLGYSQEEFLTHYTEYLTDNPINEEVVKHTDMSIQGKQQPAYEVEIYHKDGDIHRLEVNETPIFDIGGNIIAVEGIAHDITDPWMAKMQLQKARDELEMRVQQRTKELAKAIEELQEEISERKSAEKKLLVYQEELRSLASEMSLAEERMRRKVAINVHDQVGQSLAISKLKLETLRESLDRPDLAESLNEVKELLGDAIDKTRSLTMELSPPVLYELGFEAALEWLVQNAREQYGLTASFEGEGLDKPVSEDVSVMLYQA